MVTGLMFPELFKAFRIGAIRTRNRILMPPITTNFARDGFVTGQMKDYYETRAKGGVGAIIVEDAIVESTLGRHSAHDIHIDDDRFLPGLAELARAIKGAGAAALVQLNHGGARAGRRRNGYLDLTEGKIPVAPSSIAWQAGYAVPRELTVAEIEEIISRYAAAALRAKQAGFDGVSFHCTHGYLINQFLSPTTNRRDDEYGRNAEGRLRFLLRIIEETRRKVGRGYLLMARISGEDPFEGGLTLEDMKQVAHRLELAGIQAFLLSRGSPLVPPTSSKFIPSNAPMRVPRGCMVYLAEGIKQAVNVPVTAVNRINDPALAERILQEGKADLIAMGRALIADPELPNKAKAGRVDEIRTCIACQCCTDIMMRDSGVACALNAQVGREGAIDLGCVEKPKKVMVIGGGPAGMEAARVAAARGHRVELWESGPRLGGNLLVASKPPGKEEIDNFTRYLEGEIVRQGVTVKTNAPVTAADVRRLSPDAVIVATGSKPALPPIPGITKKHVVTAIDVLSGAKDAKGRVVVLGGGMVGAEVAEHLATRGREVTVVEMLKGLAADMPDLPRQLLVLALKENNVRVITGAKAEEITDSSIIVGRGREKLEIPADGVVIALGAEPDTSLKDGLKGFKAMWVGDCAKPGNVLEAVRNGFDAGATV